MAKRNGRYLLRVNLPVALEIFFSEMAATSQHSVESVIAMFLKIGLAGITRQPSLLRVMRPVEDGKTRSHFITFRKDDTRQLYLLASTCGRKPEEFIVSLLWAVWGYHHDPQSLPQKEEIIAKINFELALRFAHLRA